MSCRLEKNKAGKVNKVLNQEGKESILFQEIFNVPVLDLKESIDVYANVYSDEIQNKTKKDGIERVSQTTKQGLERAGRIATEATYTLRGSGGTVSENKTREEQIDELRIWSTDNGYYIEDYNTLGKYQEKGMESEVFYNTKSNSVVKVNDLEFYDTPLDYLNAIAVHNEIFPEAPLTVKGFTTRQDNQNFAVIVEQPFIQAERGATQEEVKEELGKMGYTHVEDNTYSDGIVTIEDLHEGNVLVDKEGKVYVIDPVIRINEQLQTTEPSATFNGYPTYGEAVKNTPIKDVIKIDIEGVNVAEITNNGDINDLIRQDILKDQRELTPSGDIVYITHGETLGKKLVNAYIAQEITRGKVNAEGNIVARVKEEETEVSKDFKKNKKEFGEDTALTILATQIIEDNTPTFGNNRIINHSVEIPSDNILMTKLKNLLQELGIKTMSLEGWAENFEKRTGQKPTSNALADISNKIIAFANGEVTQDALTEEVMHFVVEALNQEEIQPLLDMIHKTDEWKQYAPTYSEIYKNDDQLRREILAKVLKNYVQERQEQSTLQGRSITQRLVELLDRFFDRIRGLFKAQHQTQLDNFKEEIYQKLMAEELYNELSPEQFDGNKLVMYQTTQSPLYNSLTKAVETFKGLDKITGNNYQYQLNETELKEYDELNQLKATSGLANTVKNHITYLDKRGKSKGFLSTEETHVYEVTDKQLRPALEEVSAVLRSQDMINKTQQGRVLKEVEDALTSLGRLAGDLKAEKEQKAEELIERLSSEVGLTDEMKEVLKKEMETLDRDTNQFYALFGGLAHAQNPILNMLATVMSRVNRESNVQFTKRQNDLLNVLNALGFKDEDIAKTLAKFKDGYYFLSPYDFQALSLEEGKIKADIYKEITGIEVSAEEISKTEEEFKLKLSQEQVNDYMFKTTEAIRKSGLYIDVLNKGEREKIEKITDSFSPKTKNLLNQLSAKKRKIFKRAQDNGGLSSEDVHELQQVMYDQQKLSSPYDSEGLLLKGLALNDESEVVLAEGVKEEDLSAEVRTAYELNLYNQKRSAEFKGVENKAPIKFLGEVQKILKEQGLQKAVEFLKLNSRISYNSNFWDTFDSNNGIAERLRDNGQDELAELIEQNRIKLKNILKQNRTYNNPSQINFDEMSGVAISDVKDIVGKLNDYYREARELLPKEEREEVESISETVVNEAYKKQVSDRGLDAEANLDFILQHVTSDDKRAIQRNVENYRRYKNGDINNLPKAFINFDGKSLEENIIKYAESKLLPYFKELKPEGFSIDDFVVDLTQVETIEDYNKVVEDSKYISISPAYIWLDAESSDRLNPEYIKRREANEPLVNLDYKGGALRNKKYEEYFAIKNGQPTQNESEWKMLQEVLKFQEATIDSAGMEGKHNKYMLPQFRRQSLARFKQIATNVSVKNIKEAIKDAVTIREDDPLFGQSIDGQDSQNYQAGSLTVPRMGFRKLEDSEEVTEEVLYSVMLMAKEAEKRKQRVEALLDVEALRTQLQNKQFGDKQGEATTTYKMFDDFVRYNVYGQNETFKWETNFFGLSSKKHNLAPVLRLFQNWVRLVNLGFSILTPLTSLFQGGTNYFIEKFVGDRIDKDASRLARKKIPKLLTEQSAEFLNVRAKGELNLMLQFFGMDSPLERYHNSNYGKAVRGLAISKSAYLTHAMADAPLTAQVVMTVLYDFRNVNGNLVNYTEWRNKNRALTEKEARVEWGKFEGKSAYDYLEVVDGEMKMKDSYYKEVKNAEERLNFVKNRIVTAKQEIDNQIPQEDKGFAQRHSALSFFTLHKGFLISSLTKRMKSRHLNLYTGQQEEGTYNGTANFLVNVLKDAKSKGLKEAWKSQYKEYDGGYKTLEKNGKYYILKVEGKKEQIVGEYESKAKMDETHNQLVAQASRMRQVSLKRAGSDVIIANTLALIALLLKSMADDDDDNYIKQFVAYSSYRLATEVTSQSTGLPAQVYGFLESPSTGLSQIQNAMDIFDLANDDMVTQGSYRGMSKSNAWIFKSLPLAKEYNKLVNIDRTRNTYTHFNDHFLNNFTFVGLIMDDDKK